MAGALCDTNILIGTVVTLGSTVAGLLLYIWRGNSAMCKRIAECQAQCIASLPERFVSLKTYREEIKDIYTRQNKLRDELPKDYLMRSEAEIFLGAVSRLEGVVEGLRQEINGRMNQLIEVIMLNSKTEGRRG